MSAKISIVTISYNQGKFLEECIESVLSQSYDNLEYIIVDPGSTDGSRTIIEKYKSKISKIILENDKGPADGLNKGFAAATGDIFGYINADDRLVPGSLNYIDKYFAEHRETDVVCGAINIINELGEKSFRKRTSDKFNLSNYAAGICTIAQQASFFRHIAYEKTHGFNINNKIAWDGELWVDMALAGCIFKPINRILADFRVYDGSITGSGENRQRQTDDLLRLRENIRASGGKIYSSLEADIRRLFYKLNLVRHFKYISVR